jgi:hypothetical protein
MTVWIPDSGMEPLAMLENVESERHLHTLPLLLYAEQGTLQVQPERDLLQAARNLLFTRGPHRRTPKAQPGPGSRG